MWNGVRLVVSIVGPSGVGKSQLAKETAGLLGSEVANRVPTDYFIVPRPVEMTMNEFLRQPLAWDWPKLDDLIRLPLGTVTTTPDVDFTRFVRCAPSGGLPVTVRPVMLVDAMATYPRADLVVRLDASSRTRRQRVVERDKRWGTRVCDRWFQLELTERAELDGQTRLPDLYLDGERPLVENAVRLAAVIRHRLAGDNDRR